MTYLQYNHSIQSIGIRHMFRLDLKRLCKYLDFLACGGRSQEHYHFFHMANLLFFRTTPVIKSSVGMGNDLRAWGQRYQVHSLMRWQQSEMKELLEKMAHCGGNSKPWGWFKNRRGRGVSSVWQLNGEEINRWAASFGIWDELTAGWCSSSRNQASCWWDPWGRSELIYSLLFFFYLYMPLPATQGRLRQNYANVILFTLYLLLWR